MVDVYSFLRFRSATIVNLCQIKMLSYTRRRRASCVSASTDKIYFQSFRAYIAFQVILVWIQTKHVHEALK